MPEHVILMRSVVASVSGWSIARALALKPEFIVADEPVSASGCIHSGTGCKSAAGFTSRIRTGICFIAHDLAVVRHISHRIAIMYSGKIVERLSGI